MDILRQNQFAIWLALTLLGAAALMGAFFFGFNGSLVFLVLGMLSIVLLGCRDVFDYSCVQDAKTESMRQVAHRLGFDFETTQTFNVLGWSDSFELTKRAHALDTAIDKTSFLGGIAASAIPKCRNVLIRSSDDFRMALFDYEYSENEVSYRKAVVAIESPRLQHPHFILRPADALHRFLDSVRSTSSLHGKHRAVGEVGSVGLDAMAFALGSRQILEVGEGFLLLYGNERKPYSPALVETHIDEALHIFGVACEAIA